MKKIIPFLIILNFMFAQTEQPYPPLKLVSMPTGGTLPKGTFSLETLLMNNGSILPSFCLGLTDNLTIGISYGIQGFIGVGNFQKNKSYPEVQLKYRLFEETDMKPSILIGLDTQGKGNYYDAPDYERYEQKALGFYFVLSRNYEMLGNFGFHIGLNKNLFENSDGDEDINIFFGFDKALNRSFSLLAEYDFARNDNGTADEEIIRKGRGYLNAGIRWSATNNLMLEINVNDISKNNEYPSNNNYDSMNREIKIIYFENF
jgi:hypothetical protein